METYDKKLHFSVRESGHFLFLDPESRILDISSWLYIYERLQKPSTTRFGARMQRFPRKRAARQCAITGLIFAMSRLGRGRPVQRWIPPAAPRHVLLIQF